jgi:uncharacterized protein
MTAPRTKPFSLLIKPAGADCNLRCAYCFYLEKAALYPDNVRHRMSDEVLERLVASYMATPQPQYAFGWQGGEPTLMGVDFFRKVTELQKKHGRPGAVVANGLQTNGTLLDDPFAAHLAAYQFLLGVSVDGPADLHDPNRVTADGRPTHARVQEGLAALRRNKVEFNILTLVNALNSRHPGRVYQGLAADAHLFHQYIPCVEFDRAGRPMPFSVEPGAWGAFLCAIFDLWYASDTRRVSVRLFDSILFKLVNGVANVCHMGRDCRQYFMVEHNGDVYPCDFFAEPDLKLGNILHNTWEELLASPVYANFGACKATWNPACTACRWLDLCAGDCLKHRYAGSRDPRRLSYLCEGWKVFYAHTHERFLKLADQIRRDRIQQNSLFEQAAAGPAAAVGRNTACPCGSGKKYKACCGKR